MKKEILTYFSLCTQRDTSAVVFLPKDYPDDYSEDKKYPTLYALHGYWGDENSLSSENSGLRDTFDELFSDCFVVFPYIYISKTREKCTALDYINSSAYDSFIFELTCCIIPEVEKRYSTGGKRESRAVCGFSMGGREALYIGFTRPDLFSFVGAACPAPGLLPGENKALHPGQIKPEFFRPCCAAENYPKIVISAAVNDDIVGKIPYAYSDELKKNGVPHIFHEIEGGVHDNSSVKKHLEFISPILKRES